MRLLKYGFGWFLLYNTIYIFANVVLAITTLYAIPVWEFAFGEKGLYLLTIFVAALLISAVVPIVAVFIPMFLFYYAIQPYSEIMYLVLSHSGIPSFLAIILTSFAWFPAVMDVYLAWGLGVLIGSVIGLRAFPSWHRVYSRILRKFEGVI